MTGGDIGGEGKRYGRNQKCVQNLIAHMARKCLLEDLNIVGELY